jgi:hypothetical protein
MNKDSKQRVFDALSTIRPKSVRQLADETGLSVGSVHAALTALNAEPTGGFPERWMRHLPPTPDDVVHSWRYDRRATAEGIQHLVIAQGSDPVELADRFLAHGRRLTEIGTEIDRVKMNPDWYEQLGGKL